MELDGYLAVPMTIKRVDDWKTTYSRAPFQLFFCVVAFVSKGLGIFVSQNRADFIVNSGRDASPSTA